MRIISISAVLLLAGVVSANLQENRQEITSLMNKVFSFAQSETLATVEAEKPVSLLKLFAQDFETRMSLKTIVPISETVNQTANSTESTNSTTSTNKTTTDLNTTAPVTNTTEETGLQTKNLINTDEITNLNEQLKGT